MVSAIVKKKAKATQIQSGYSENTTDPLILLGCMLLLIADVLTDCFDIDGIAA